MSFPNIPNVTPSINIDRGDVINLLLASIAFEELGLAHIINAEAEKIQFALGTLNGTNLPPSEATLPNLLEVNNSVRKTLKTVLKNEMLLQFKMEDVLALTSSRTCTPTTSSFTNNELIVVPEATFAGIPYPSQIQVSGLQGSIQKVTVTIHNYTDLVGPSDHMSILIVAPDNTASLILSHVGSGPNATVTFTIDDDAASTLPQVGPIPNGTFQPSVYGPNNNLLPPAPQTAPYPTNLSVFNGLNPNGTWGLYLYDYLGGHGVTINDGWTLTITTDC